MSATIHPLRPERVILIADPASYTHLYVVLPIEALPFLAQIRFAKANKPYETDMDLRDYGTPVEFRIADASAIRPEDPPTPAAPAVSAPIAIAAAPTEPALIASRTTDAPGTLHCPPIREFVDEFRDEVPL